jgi:hypothetical protein
MVASLIIATTLITQVQVQAGATRDSAGRQVSVGVQIGASAADSNRRIPVTAAHLATAFKDAGARSMLLNARAARFRQDSALRSYDAKVRQRISVGVSMKAAGRERLVVRDEGVARVQWQKDAGAVVDILGKRTTVPMADDPEQIDTGLRNETSLPIPYFPGRETLWIGGSVAQVSVDEGSFVHPIASGAEAYYKYETGDSVIYTIGDDKKITLRELRILARVPRWNVIVGSFWYDQATSQLVRAVYRPSIELNVWEVAMDEAKRDTSHKDEAPPWWVRGLVSPLKMTMDVFVVEYGLFEGRFWLPTSQGAEGRGQAMMIRVPVTFEERYEYTSVNAAVDVAGPMASVPRPPITNSEIRDSLAKRGMEKKTIDSLMKVRNDSINAAIRGRQGVRVDSVRIRHDLMRDSLMKTGMSRKAADEAIGAREQIVRDSIRVARETSCAVDANQQRGYSMRRFRRYRGSVDVLLRVPCDLRALAHSPELPASAFDPGEEVFGKKQREEMMDALDFGLQAGWGPQKLDFDFGFGQSRYNRVEGLSTGIAVHQQVGMGYAWSAQLRGGTGDQQLNGELGVDRSNGRTTYKLNAYRRLVSANDWGTTLTFSSSLPALVSGRDEGVYFRSWGGELVRTTSRNKQLDWRLFAEEQWTADVTTRFSFFGGRHDKSFGPNVTATRGTYAGASVRWRDSWGIAPRGWKVLSDFRLEGAGGETEYGRGALDLSVAHPIIGPLSFGLTAAAGSSVGDLPAQRYWFLGGSPTVRGQVIGIDSLHAGNAFWFSRFELARQKNTSRLSIFGDLGWAGSRDSDWGRSRRLLSGIGIGSSFMDGLFRTDISRGLWPRKGWRLDFSVEAPF